MFQCFLCYDNPEVDPFISSKEKLFLKEEIKHRTKERAPTPWKDMLTSPSVWAATFAQVSSLIL